MTPARRVIETEEHLNLRRSAILSLFVIGNLFFIYLLARGAFSGYTAWRLQFTGRVATGNVVGYREARDIRPHIIRYYPIIEYRVGTQTYTISSDPPPGNKEDYPTGSQVGVLYDPADPSIARINSWEQVWFYPEFIFIFVPIASVLGNLSLLRAWLGYKERLRRYKEWQGLSLKDDQ